MTSLPPFRRLPLLLAVVSVALALPLCGTPARGALWSDGIDPASAPVERLAERAAQASAGAVWRLSGLEVPTIGSTDLILERFELFTPDLRYLVDGEERPVPSDLRQMSFWRGVVADQPGSGAFLRFGPASSVEGFLRLGESRFLVAANPAGELIVTPDLSALLDDSPQSCGTDASLVRPDGRLRAGAEMVAGGAAAKKPKKPIPAPPGLFTAAISVETDHSMFINALGDPARVHQNVAGLFGEISAITDRELGLALVVNYLAVYPSPNDPWSETTDGITLLQELRAFWKKNRPYAKYPRAATHLVTGRAGLSVGGVAYVYGACDGSNPDPYDFGLARNNVLTIAHELGHTLGSFHTHCYVPPVDQCFAAQANCYSGPESIPPGGGSLMSYCNERNASYGEAGKYGNASERVPAELRSFIDTIYPGCLSRRSDPFELQATAVTPNSVTLAWKDVFAGEKGWVVEVQNKNTFKIAKQTGANATGVTLTGLKTGQTYVYRVYAKFKGNVSERSFTVVVAPV